MNPALLVGAAVVVVMACVIASRYFSRRRSQEIRRAAVAKGLSFEDIGHPFSDAEMQQILRFTRRRGHRCHFVAKGTVEGLETIFFEHHARNGGHESVAAFRVPVPDFELILLRHAVNAAVMAGVFSHMGFSLVNFDCDPDFSRNYLLTGRDESVLREIFDESLRSFFCVPPGTRHWAAESGAGWLLVYRPDRLIRPAGLGHFLDEAALVVTAVRRQCSRAAAAG